MAESGLIVCRAIKGIPGGTYAQQLDIEPLISAELFLRPGKILQRHKRMHLCSSVLQCVAVHGSVLQCVAMCCNVLQCVAVHCSV